jgi:hypothetical protein
MAVPRQKGWGHQDVIAADAVVAQAQLRHRHPRVPFFYSGAVPKEVSAPLGVDRRWRLGRHLVDGNREHAIAGRVAAAKDQIIEVEGSRRTAGNLVPQNGCAIEELAETAAPCLAAGVTTRRPTESIGSVEAVGGLERVEGL